jgi:hypothetical protein
MDLKDEKSKEENYDMMEESGSYRKRSETNYSEFQKLSESGFN